MLEKHKISNLIINGICKNKYFKKNAIKTTTSPPTNGLLQGEESRFAFVHLEEGR